MDAEDMELTPQTVMRDNDTKFAAPFDAVIESADVEVKRNTPRSPNLRAHVERFIQTLKHECLDKFVIVAERHLNYVNREWRLHYNRERPHSARDHLPPDFEPPTERTAEIRPTDIVCTTRLGGLLRSYERRAAGGVVAGSREPVRDIPAVTPDRLARMPLRAAHHESTSQCI